MTKTALFTDLLRGEICKLKWQEVGVERGFVHIRDPKADQDHVTKVGVSVIRFLMLPLTLGERFLY